MASYQYQRLSDDLYNIRLLKVLPNSDFTSKIDCELFHENINNTDRPPYEALSYTWGDASLTVDIRVNGCIFPANPNLEAALRALRITDKPRILWVDGICIDQTNIKERGEQVRIMWHIYKAAECVVVWLGPEEGDSAIAMENFARREAQTRLSARKEWRKERPAEHKGHWCGCHAGDLDTYPPRIGVQKLAERRWFTRVWVLQEVAAAKRVVVVCGDKAVSGNDFCHGMIASVAPTHQTLQRIMPRIRPALDLIMKQSTTDLGLGSRPLLELIENFRTWDATEPVDKVYSLLAFSSDASTVPELQPDYAIPQSVLARRLVNFAFPDSLISPQSTNHDEVEFEIEGLLLGKTSSMTWNGETFWNFQAGESVVPNVIFNPVVLELFKDKWDIRIASGRRLQDDSAVVLLRGASRPTVLRFHEGQYIVDMLATTEPLKGGSELAFKHLLSTPPEYKDMGWSEALKALSAESEGFMKFKLSWDPFRQLDPSEYSRYTPTPNSMRTQWDARLESLKDAAENGSKDYLDCAFLANLVAVLYCEGKKLKAGTSEYTMTIHKAAYNGYHGTVKLLLDSNVEVDSRDSEHNMTGLHLAAKQGHPKVVRALLDAKATVDSLDGFNKTPLDHAVLEGNSEICQMLLDAGADPNPLGRICNPLLFDAVNKDYVVIVTKLLKAGADVNTVIDLGPVAGPTLLHVAAEMGRKALVTVLLEAGAQVNPRIMTGATPLHQAAVYGHTEVVKLLLNAGADVDAQEHDGMTPLDNSLYCGQLETAQAILQAGGRQSATAPNIDEWEDVDEEGANTAEGVGEEEDVDEEQYLHEEENVDEKQGICENGATSEKEDMNEEKILMERLILTMKKVSIESKKSIRRKMLTSSRIST